MAWAVNRSGSVRGRRRAPGEGRAAARPATIPTRSCEPRARRRSPSGSPRPAACSSYALDRAIADPDGATGPRGARQRVRAGGADAGEGRRRGGGRRAVARGRRQARRRPDPALDRGPAAAGRAADDRRAGCRGTATPASTPPVERDLVALLLHSPEARAALLPLLDEPDDARPRLRSARSWARSARDPRRRAESLMTELATDEARSVLSALLVEDRETH